MTTRTFSEGWSEDRSWIMAYPRFSGTSTAFRLPVPEDLRFVSRFPAPGTSSNLLFYFFRDLGYLYLPGSLVELP
jgi:hypothetical protein